VDESAKVLGSVLNFPNELFAATDASRFHTTNLVKDRSFVVQERLERLSRYVCKLLYPQLNFLLTRFVYRVGENTRAFLYPLAYLVKQIQLKVINDEALLGSRDLPYSPDRILEHVVYKAFVPLMGNPNELIVFEASQQVAYLAKYLHPKFQRLCCTQVVQLYLSHLKAALSEVVRIYLLKVCINFVFTYFFPI